MELKDRLRLILDERHLKQKDFASTVKITESYVSNMLKGKRSNISETLAMLIEQTYGYSAQWILTGEGERYSTQANIPELSPAKKRIIAEIEKMSETELDAVKIFINSLDEYKKAFNRSDTSLPHDSKK